MSGAATDVRPTSAGRDLGMLLGGALVVRVLYLVVVIHGRPALSDADQYLDIAKNVANGRGLAMQWPQLHVHPTAYRPPLFPLLLGGWIKVFGESVTTARCLNVLIGLAVVAATYLVARRLGGRSAGLVAAGAVSVYPPLLANDATTLAEPLGLLLLLGMTWAFLVRRWWALGLLGGLLTLTKPAAQGFVVVVVLLVAALLWVEATREGRGLRHGGARRWVRSVVLPAVSILGCAALLVIPWVIRNRVELGTTSIVTSNGFTLSAIYASEAQARGEFLDPVFGAPYQSLDERLLRWDEGRWNDVLTRRALDGLASNPGYVGHVVRRNLGYWFELTPARNDAPEWIDGRHLTVRHWTLPLFYVVTAAGAAGLLLALRSAGRARRGALFLAVASCYFTATSLVLVATPRLRAPLDLACCIGCGLLAARLLSSRPRRPPDPAAVPPLQSV